jgi:hypothetical protein
VPGVGVALLPFGEKPLEAVEESCTSNKLGKTACQAAFSTCLTTTATKVLVESVSADAVKCVLTGIKDGVTGAGSSSSGGSGTSSGSPGCSGCKGCCQEGACKDGSVAEACGTGGDACETCSAGAACTEGKCVSACGPDSCAGCCDASGQCQTGGADATCGSGGAACVACAGANSCSEGQCIATSCKASCAAGCCSAAGCQTGNTTAACGSGGNACVACGGGRVCEGGTCKLGTSSTWDVVLVAAHLPAKNAGGGDWDPFGGLPDPFAQATSGATVGATTAGKANTLNAVWNANVLENVSATSLKAQLKIELWDDDTVFHDHVGICLVAVTDASFDGTLKTASCPPAASGDAAFTVDYRLKAH